MSQTASTELQQSQQPTPHSSTPFNSHTPSLEYPPSVSFQGWKEQQLFKHLSLCLLIYPHPSTTVSHQWSIHHLVPQRAPTVDSTHLPATTSLQGIERFFDDNNAAGNLQGYDLVIPTSISLDNQVRCTYFNLIDSVYLLREIYTY